MEPISFRTAITATGSVVELRKPKSRANDHGRLSSDTMANFIAIAVNTAQMTQIGYASKSMLTICLLKMNQSQLKADSKTRGGMNMNRIRDGSM